MDVKKLESLANGLTMYQHYYENEKSYFDEWPHPLAFWPDPIFAGLPEECRELARVLWADGERDVAKELKRVERNIDDGEPLGDFQQLVDALELIAETDVPDGGDASSSTRHSRDFRSVDWYGTDYRFTATQAAMFKELYESWRNGTPDVGGETLLELADAKTSRLVDIFRSNTAWGTLIVEGHTKGSYRLAEPPNS